MGWTASNNVIKRTEMFAAPLMSLYTYKRIGNKKRRHINLEGGGHRCGGWRCKWVKSIKLKRLGVLAFQGMKMKSPKSFQE